MDAAKTGVIDRYPIKKFDTDSLSRGKGIGKDLPSYLYYRGDITLLESDVVAVIGTREISERGRAITRNVTEALCRRGKTILNGLALGCDAEALRETVACGGRGIAVMPCGLDEIYPKTNRKLAEELLENGGCLVSEYPAGVHPRKESFVARDRLQAMFSGLVIVIESKQGSGTWHTVEYARRYQRLVACYMEKDGRPSEGNEILVQHNKAYAMSDSAGMDYILELSQNRFEQMELPL